jgi:hypothetical protein
MQKMQNIQHSFSSFIQLDQSVTFLMETDSHQNIQLKFPCTLRPFLSHTSRWDIDGSFPCLLRTNSDRCVMDEGFSANNGWSVDQSDCRPWATNLASRTFSFCPFLLNPQNFVEKNKQWITHVLHATTSCEVRGLSIITLSNNILQNLILLANFFISMNFLYK